VLKQTEKLVPVDLLHVAIFNERYEKPESESFGAMQQQLCHDKVHTLYIADFSFVVTKSQEYSS